MDNLRNADESYLDDGVKLLELAMNARRLFEQQEPREKRKLLDFLLSNSTWKDGRLHPNFKQPFDLIADAASAALVSHRQNDAEIVKTEIWLGNQDSQTCRSKPMIHLINIESVPPECATGNANHLLV